MAGVHYSNRLEDQAASTALNSHKEQRRPSVLDEDGKLSSASAALSLKYANAQDLPSYPSAGLKMSSAGAAASLADSNKKNFEHWKPGAIPAANRAAMLAKDYEMDPLWQPELSKAGSKAALLAHKDTTSPNIWQSQKTEEGASAAGQALKVKSPNAITERNVSSDNRQKALLAATGAMAGNRPRAGSTPIKADDKNWALKAATQSQKGATNMGPFTTGDPGFEAARIQNIAKGNVNRQLYGSTPPVAIEVEEKNRQDMLRASAVAMAKKMYAIQQTHIDEAAGLRKSDSRAAANSSHRRTLSESSGDEPVAAPRYENLEEAARKLAQERLAKMQDEHAEYRQYYGQGQPQTRSRLSMRLRRRSTGGRDDDSDDEEQSRRIKKQMSIFQNNLAEVDNKKRQSDRDALLQAAHRNVEARMAQLDEKVFQETGKASPAQRDMWEQQAREKAQKASDERMQNVGKVHIGGGKYLDQAEVDAIAKARLQPTLDEIHESAERQRARDVEIRAEQQRVQDQQARDRAREAEVKAELKAAQEQEKMEARRKKEEEKQASREQAATEKEARRAEAAAEKERLRKEKEERQAVVAEEKEKARLEKEEKRKSVEVKPSRFNSILKKRGKEDNTTETEGTATATIGTSSTEEPSIAVLEGDTVHDQVTMAGPASARSEEPVADLIREPTTETIEGSPTRSISYDDTVPGAAPTTATPTTAAPTTAAPTTTAPAAETPTSPAKRESKVVSWFKTLKGSNKTKEEEAASAQKTVPSGNVDQARDESIRDVAMAGRETSDLYGSGTHEEDRPVSPVRNTDATGASRTSSVSSYSTHDVVVADARPLSGTEHTAQVGRTGLKAKLLKKIAPEKHEESNTNRNSVGTDDETYENAKYTQDEEKLVLPPTLSSARPASPRASHEHSKFKEEL